MTPGELKAWRKERGLTRAELEKHLGLKPRSLEGPEQGTQKMPEMLELALPEVDRRLKEQK